MTVPTQEDGKMLIELAQLGVSYRLMDAMPAIFAEDFDPDTADVMDAPIRSMLAYGELLGTLVKHDLISSELLHDYLWLAGIWQRVGPAAKRQREHLGEPRLYENFEALALADPS